MAVIYFLDHIHNRILLLTKKITSLPQFCQVVARPNFGAMHNAFLNFLISFSANKLFLLFPTVLNNIFQAVPKTRPVSFSQGGCIGLQITSKFGIGSSETLFSA